MVGDARLTFAPGALPADAYVLVTQTSDNAFGLLLASSVYDLHAYDARTGELIETFLVAPELTIFVGRGLTLAPSIVYIDPASGAETMVSFYDSVAGTVTARLPHFSHYTATFASGVWEITLPTGVNEVLIAVSGGDLVVTIDGEVESQAIAGLTSLSFIGAEAGDDFDFDPSTAGLTVPIKLSNSEYSLGGFVHVSGDVDFGTPAFVDSNVGSGHLLVSLTINNATAFIGSGYGTPGQIGFSATLDSFVGALLVDTSGGREWHALTADFSLLSFGGIDDLTLALTDLDVELNSRASDGSVVDWTTVTGATPPINFTGAVRTASGTATINIFNYLSGGVSFDLEQRTVDLDTDAVAGTDLTGATLTTLSLTVTSPIFIGADGVGFTVAGGSVSVAAIEPASDLDTRSWVAFSGSLTGVSFGGVPGLTLTLSTASVSFNRGTSAGALDWVADLDLDQDGTYSENGDPVGETSDDLLTLEGVEIEFTDAFQAVSGTAVVDIFGFIAGSAAFDYSSRSVDVDLDGVAGAELIGATLSTLELTITSPVTVGPTDGVHLSVSAGTLAVAALSAPTPTAPVTDDRHWTGVVASGVSASLLGVDGLTLAVTGGSFKFNSASGAYSDGVGGTPVDAVALDWSEALASAPVDLDGELLSLAGTATIDVFGFFTGQFIFTVDTTTVSATVGTGGGVNRLSGAQLTTLSLELDGSDVTIGPAEWSASGDPRRHQARRRRPEARDAGGRRDLHRYQGMDRREGDRRRRLTGGDRRADAVDHRRQLLLQQRLRGA